MVADFDEQAAEQIIPPHLRQLASHQGCVISLVLLVLWCGPVNSTVGRHLINDKTLFVEAL